MKQVAITGFDSRLGGMNGSAARPMCQKNSVHISPQVATSPRIDGENQANAWPPKDRARSSGTAPPVTKKMPSRSSRCPRGVPGTRRRTLLLIRMAARPRGRLIQKMKRQPIWSAITPPRIGPIIPDTANMPSTYPWNRPRSRGAMTSATMICATACIAPPKMPWKLRAAISIGRLTERAQTTEPSMKPHTAISSVGRRPSVSQSLPNSGMPTVPARR